MRRAAFALFATVAGLVGLLSFKTHAPSVGTVPVAVSTGGGGVPTSAAAAVPSSGSTSSGTAGATSSATSTGTRTVTGDSVDTRWGPVQVRITVTNGTLTRAAAIVYPTENPRDQEINSYAIPALEQEAVAAGNAHIDTISGATYTSTGYINSLQSALDKAGLR